MKNKIGFAVVMMLMMLSCNKEEDFRIECATLDQGWLDIENRTGIDLLVDATWDDIKENSPIVLNVLDFGGQPMTTIYDHIPAGTVKVWFSPNNGDNWFWKTVEVQTCEKTYCVIDINEII